MSLKTYTLSVSLAAIIGLLVTAAPLVRNILEYRSPSVQLEAPKELATLEAFVLAKGGQEMVNAMLGRRALWDAKVGKEWERMYDDARAQYSEAERQQVQAIRSKAAHNVTGYGTLCALCVVLLMTHLLWARRLQF